MRGNCPHWNLQGWFFFILIEISKYLSTNIGYIIFQHGKCIYTDTILSASRLHKFLQIEHQLATFWAVWPPHVTGGGRYLRAILELRWRNDHLWGPRADHGLCGLWNLPKWRDERFWHCDWMGEGWNCLLQGKAHFLFPFGRRFQHQV